MAPRNLFTLRTQDATTGAETLLATVPLSTASFTSTITISGGLPSTISLPFETTVTSTSNGATQTLLVPVAYVFLATETELATALTGAQRSTASHIATSTASTTLFNSALPSQVEALGSDSGHNGHEHSISSGAIAGAVVGVLIAIVLVAIASWCLGRRFRKPVVYTKEQQVEQYETQQIRSGD